MSCETVLEKTQKQDTLYKIAFRGITAVGDMALWKKPLYSNASTALLLSLYGSENQLRGIFSSLATGYQLKLNGESLTRSWDGNLKFKKSKIGYGKCHALIWNEKIIPECVITFASGEDIAAWEKFLKRRKIPLLKKWLPKLTGILKKQGLVEELSGINLKGWHLTTSDDQVCDYIVKEIYR